jgi:hypothetical protein
MIGYRIKLAPDDNGTVLITCPALPEVTTLAKTMPMRCGAQPALARDNQGETAATIRIRMRRG